MAAVGLVRGLFAPGLRFALVRVWRPLALPGFVALARLFVRRIGLLDPGLRLVVAGVGRRGRRLLLN